MKKIISMVLALVMVMGLSVTAMAEEPNKTGEVRIIDQTQKPYEETITVPAKGSVAPFTNDNETYYVIMDWSVESTLTYTVNATDYKWNVYNVKGNTETLLTGKTTVKDKTATMGRYDVNDKWSGTATITVNVTNWSNVDITAKATWKDSEKPTKGTPDNGVTKDIKIAGMPENTEQTITRADDGIDASNFATTQVTNNTATKLFEAKIDNDTEGATCKITDGAIKNTEGGYSAIIGTLTVKIEKASTTTAGGN